MANHRSSLKANLFDFIMYMKIELILFKLAISILISHIKKYRILLNVGAFLLNS